MAIHIPIPMHTMQPCTVINKWLRYCCTWAQFEHLMIACCSLLGLDGIMISSLSSSSISMLYLVCIPSRTLCDSGKSLSQSESSFSLSLSDLLEKDASVFQSSCYPNFESSAWIQVVSKAFLSAPSSSSSWPLLRIVLWISSECLVNVASSARRRGVPEITRLSWIILHKNTIIL